MKLTKVLSLILCFLLVYSPALAQNESEKMKEVLTTAKTILSVPEEYNEFSYRSQTDADGMVYWSFSWSGEKKGNIDATLSEDGFLASYYAWIYTDSYDDSLANYTHEEAKKIAEDFIRTVNPEIYPTLREVTPDGENRNSRTAYFVFREYYESRPALANTVSVTVDKHHGIVRNYSGTRKIKNFSIQAPELTEAEAKSRYLHDIGIRMEYRTYYDYKTKTHTVFPVYYLKNTSGKSIHAVTGEVIEPYFPESYLFGTLMNSPMADATMKEEAAAGNSVQFTPEELAALSNVGEVYAQEEALKIVAEKIPAVQNYALRSASLQRDYRDETKLFWYFEFQNEEGYYRASVQMNAKTGQLLGFSFPQNETENKNFTKEDAQKIAEDFLKNEASDVFATTEYTEEADTYVPLAKEDFLPQSYFFTYQRMENGIPVSGNRLTVRVDADTKQIGSYNRSYTEGLTFPDISTCISQEEIIEIMDEAMEFTLVHFPTKEGQTIAYTFLNPDSQMFDPYTGTVLNYDGSPITKTFLPEYTDIKGHWAEEMVLTLLDNGYYLCENEFHPDDTITKKEFLKLFGMIGNDSDEQIKELIAQIEEIDQENADADAALTKQMVSRYFVYRMGYQKVAAMDHIFRYPFLDEARAEDSLKGDIALVAGFGIFLGSPDGNFYPQKELTRAEAVSAIYHYLQPTK